MARIIVVDDERAIADGVAAYLRREGHDVDTAATPELAIELGRTGPDLMILDVMLQGGSGFDVLRTLRGEGLRVPVVILSARVDLVDRVAGLELGADDYVTKPFEPRELVARVGAVLRRAQPERTEQPGPLLVRVHDLEIDKEARQVLRGSTLVTVTRTEFDLLVALAAHPGHVMTRSGLAEQIFGGLYEESDRTIDSHVRNLRRKLGPRPDGGDYVETIRGVGYRVARG
ncbi:MAG: response regulator transcription factor [Candidatus Limnocylindrales bacterium]